MKRIILEEIESMKKMMAYDTSKTLTENIKTINEVKGLVDGGSSTGGNTTGGGGGTTRKRSSGGQTTSKYTSCPETLPIEKFCMNDTVKKVQGCLGSGLSQDGKFGPKTQEALENKGLFGKKITQFTIDTVCKDGESNKTKGPDSELITLKPNETITTPTQTKTGMDIED